ncbi:SOS response-associated peptidase [Flavobacterium sp. WC2430]|uniref:SOS response-associated peptidase n=1 Tax=Flavobacterium sp. WC2430 TaxID=3234137 RepID=UPI003466B8B2
MCFFTQQVAICNKVETRFSAKVDNREKFIKSDFVNGFSYPNLPVIIDEKPDIISTDFTWGLIPSWAKDDEIRKNTLNARIETVEEKPSFKNCVNNRCLVIVTGYFEWHWNDSKGKEKEKYLINSQEDEIFCLAGLYSNWLNPSTGDIVNTYTILTTEADKTMQYVHNHKKRMPVMINRIDERKWLDDSISIKDFAYPNYQPNLIAFQTQ